MDDHYSEKRTIYRHKIWDLPAWRFESDSVTKGAKSVQFCSPGCMIYKLVSAINISPSAPTSALLQLIEWFQPLSSKCNPLKDEWEFEWLFCNGKDNSYLIVDSVTKWCYNLNTWPKRILDQNGIITIWIIILFFWQ